MYFTKRELQQLQWAQHLLARVLENKGIDKKQTLNHFENLIKGADNELLAMLYHAQEKPAKCVSKFWNEDLTTDVNDGNWKGQTFHFDINKENNGQFTLIACSDGKFLSEEFEYQNYIDLDEISQDISALEAMGIPCQPIHVNLFKDFQNK